MPYIGKSPTGSAVRQRYHFTATGGETSLSGTDDNSKTLKFTDGEYIDVYLNGILLVQGTDYGVGTVNTISSLAALAANDIVEVVVYDIYNVAKINSEAIRARHYYTATGSETSIGTSQIAGLSFAANADIDVSLNGISLVAGTDYNTTTANTVSGLTALTAGQVVEIVIYEKFQLADTVSKASGGTFNGGVTFNSGLNVGTIKEATGTTTAMTIDSSGHVLAPVNPKFSIILNSSTGNNDYTSSSTTDVPFDTEDFDVGNCMSISSDVATFTAPVTGYYQFNLLVQLENVDGAAHANTYLSIDGSTTTSARNEDYRTIEDPQGGTFITITSSHLIYLTANQTVNPKLFINNDTSASVRLGTRFSGFLVP